MFVCSKLSRLSLADRAVGRGWTRPRRDPARAFTLVELLVVISIMALLVAILLPSLGEAKERARQVACASNKRQVGVALFAYASANRDWFPAPIYATPWFYNSNAGVNWPKVLKPYANDLRILTDPSNPHAPPPDSPLNTTPNFNLSTFYYYAGYVNEAGVWPCPVGKITDSPKYGLFQDVVHWAVNKDWGDVIGNHMKGGTPHNPISPNNPSATILNVDSLSKVRGANVLFVGGHVNFLTIGNGLNPVVFSGKYYHYVPFPAWP